MTSAAQLTAIKTDINAIRDCVAHVIDAWSDPSKTPNVNDMKGLMSHVRQGIDTAWKDLSTHIDQYDEGDDDDGGGGGKVLNHPPRGAVEITAPHLNNTTTTAAAAAAATPPSNRLDSVLFNLYPFGRPSSSARALSSSSSSFKDVKTAIEQQAPWMKVMVMPMNRNANDGSDGGGGGSDHQIMRVRVNVACTLSAYMYIDCDHVEVFNIVVRGCEEPPDENNNNDDDDEYGDGESSRCVYQQVTAHAVCGYEWMRQQQRQHHQNRGWMTIYEWLLWLSSYRSLFSASCVSCRRVLMYDSNAASLLPPTYRTYNDCLPVHPQCAIAANNMLGRVNK